MSGERVRRVYSTGPDGAVGAGKARCKRCASDPCRCEPARSRPAGEQVVRVRRERAGRRGKTVTVVGPLHLAREDASALLKKLKSRCGGGGTLKVDRDGGGDPCFVLEVQGDHADRVVSELDGLGYDVKRAGG